MSTDASLATIAPTGHVQVKPERKGRGYWAYWRDAEGRHGKRLGPAHVKDSGRRTARGAIVWRAGDGAKPSPDHLTPKEANERLAEILVAAPRQATRDYGGTLRRAVEGMIEQRARDGGLKRSTRADYADMAARVYRDLGADTPVTELDEARLSSYIADFDAERAVGERTARQAKSEGRSVRRVTNLQLYASPPGQEPVEVATIAEARQLAAVRGWRFKHRRRGVYRVTPPNGRRPKKVSAGEAEALAAERWTIREEARQHWVICDPASPQTRNKYRDFLGAAFDWAIEQKWLTSNAVDAVKRAGRRGERERILRRTDFYDRDEVTRFLAEVTDTFEEAFYLCGFDAGLRLPGEALGLAWGAADFAADVVRPYGNWVRNSAEDQTKTGYVVPVPMTPRLRRALQRVRVRDAYTADSDYVFTRDLRSGLPVDGAEMRERFKELAARAGLKPIPMYNARHSFGTALARDGVDVRTISGLMRHRRLSTTEVYMAYAPHPDLQRRLVRALEGTSAAAGQIQSDDFDEGLFWLRLREEVPAKWSETIARIYQECCRRSTVASA
jgi:integrase